MGEGEDSHGDHGLGSLVELRFKAPPDTSYSFITITISGKRNCASWARSGYIVACGRSSNFSCPIAMVVTSPDHNNG
jgi:hypothetical protein